MRAKALALTLMLVFGLAGLAMADSHDPYDPAGGGNPAPSAGGGAAKSSQDQADASGGAAYGATTGSAKSTPARPVVPGYKAKLLPSGKAAAPAMAPKPVQRAVWAANEIVGKPYLYGGGHTANFKSRGYDCSGTVSYALHFGAPRWLRSPLPSGGFTNWGAKGKGRWITIYTNPGHMYAVIAGLRLDTSAAGDPSGAKGPRWRPNLRETSGYVVRHPAGF